MRDQTVLIFHSFPIAPAATKPGRFTQSPPETDGDEVRFGFKTQRRFAFWGSLGGIISAFSRSTEET
jgi:hypothetical protein